MSYYDDSDPEVRRATPSYPTRRQYEERSFPRRPSFQPPRRPRRASTLPVRFEDENVIERVVRPEGDRRSTRRAVPGGDRTEAERRVDRYAGPERVVVREPGESGEIRTLIYEQGVSREPERVVLRDRGESGRVRTVIHERYQDAYREPEGSARHAALPEEYVDSVASDSEIERGERRRDVTTEREQEVAALRREWEKAKARGEVRLEEDEEVTPLVASPSRSPVRAREREDGSETNDVESVENSFPAEGQTRVAAGLVSPRAIVYSGYSFEIVGDTIIIPKALSRDAVDELIRLTETFRREDSPKPWDRPEAVASGNFRSRSRSRSRPRVYRGRYEDCGRDRRIRSRLQYDEQDVDAEQEAYSFSLSRHRKSLVSRDSTVGSLSDVSEKEFVPASQAPSNSAQVGKYLRVLGSKYTGEGSVGGFQSATLKVSEDTTQGARKSLQSVFKWVQFEDISMNLERFESGCDNIVSLTESQKSAISRLFNRVRRKFDRQMESPDGSKLRQMAPSILHESVPGNEKSRGVVTWMCLPYFSLQKYAGNLSGLPPSSHPIRTLLQSHFSFAQKGRDMQQAVCKLSGTPPDHCFHIAQVWCLVLDDALIITCSRAPIISLMGTSLSISPESSSPDRSKSSQNRPTNLLVYSENLLWSLPLEECQSWFAFLSHFWEYWPRRIQFSTGGKIITPESWAKVIGQPSKSSIRISLSIRPSSKEPRGMLLPPTSAVPLTETPSDKLESGHRSAPSDGSAGNSSKANPEKISIDEVNNRAQSQQELTEKSTPDTPLPAQPGKQYNTKQLNKNFHVFTWLNEVQSTTLSTGRPPAARSLSPDNQTSGVNDDWSFILDELNLRADLKEMDRFLKRETSFEERLIYTDCPQYSREDVYMLLKNEGKALAAVTWKDPGLVKGYEDKVEIFNKAEALFEFFLPSQFDGRTVRKYWGAVHRLLVALPGQDRVDPNNPYRETYAKDVDADEVLQWLRYTARTTQAFREAFSEANSDERSTIQLPEQLPKAWLHLVMVLVCSSNEQDLFLFRDQTTICSLLLNEGTRNLVESLGQKSLLEYAVFKPWEVASLVNFVLLSDISGTLRDTSETYVEYLNHLVSAIESNPLDRGHQDKLTAFKQEIRVILKTLSQQQRILDYAERIATASKPSEITVPITQQEPLQDSPYLDGPRLEPEYYSRSRSRTYPREQAGAGRLRHHPTRTPCIEWPRTSGSQIDPTDPSGIQSLLIQDSNALIDRKMRLFEELKIRAEELEDENNFKIDYNKDRQDSAIYAFTIVTIIFLPLSTVAGILGMNTNDVRNMEINQWVFWATALPLTAVIMTLCLIWAGEFENFWKGFRNLWRGKEGRGGSGGGGVGEGDILSAGADAYSMMDPRAVMNRRRERERVTEQRPPRPFYYQQGSPYLEPSHHRSRARSYGRSYPPPPPVIINYSPPGDYGYDD